MFSSLLRLCVLYFVSLVILSHAFANGLADGLYEVTGTHSVLGDYSGQVSVHGSSAERLIHWKHYAPKLANAPEELETVWTGSVSGDQLHFSLNLSNVLTSYESYQPSTEELQRTLPVSLHVPSETAPVEFAVSGEGTYKETWKRFGDAPLVPLWKSGRHIVDATGTDEPWIAKLMAWLGVRKAVEWYRSQPQIAPYANRPEFRDEKQYYILDSTDQDFYRSHPESLRIPNHTVNPLSLAEALMKRNAFAPALSWKADFFRNQMVQNHLNSAGLIELVELNERGEKTGRAPDYDSALWTAMFGYAELLKYQVTQAPESLQTFRKILDGTLTLVEISGNKKDFARAIAISSPEENLGPGWSQGTGRYAHLKWRSGGNNDMIKGVILTLILAHRVIGPEERELRSRILNASRSLFSTDAAHYNSLNTGLINGLIALWSHDESKIEQVFPYFINLLSVLGEKVAKNGSIYYKGIADWSGIHLTMVSAIDQILLAQELQNQYPNSDYSREIAEILKDGKYQLLQAHHAYRILHRDFLSIFTYLLASDASNHVALRADALEALESLRELPAPRFIGSGTVDLTKNAQWSYSAWPRVPWKALRGIRKLKSSLDFELFEQGVYSYPVYETQTWSTQYLWKESPFGIKFTSNPKRQPFSSDYLVVYWAARASNLLSSGD
ncbi:MAG: hypothetical protein ACJ763_14300 [Bdellovibrionia bacterium]